jgi:DMSO/TMAO reductase YedYZ molybdopterin-dependent catalytic subunit
MTRHRATSGTTRRGGFWAGAFTGLLSAGVALGIAELVAAALRPAASPVVGVGETAINHTPPPVKDFAVQNFGSNDKLVLLSGIYTVLLIFAIVIGLLARRRLWAGLVGIGVFGVIGAASELSLAASRPTDAIPSIIGAIAGGITMVLLARSRVGRSATGQGLAEDTAFDIDPWAERQRWDDPPGAAPAYSDSDSDWDRIDPDHADVGRRSFIATGATAAIVGVVAGAGGYYMLGKRFSVTASQKAVKLAPVTDVPKVPANVDLKVPGLSPFYTPNGTFYRVDTALALPTVPADQWSLKIHGMVDREMTISFADLMKRPMIERDITICCVSEPVGGGYIGNARWQGVRLADILREAGVKAGADQIVSKSSDGMSVGTPVAAIMDGRDAMLAVGMNGAPLPAEHGFPVRMVVPGLYGYVSACKWVVDMELTTFAAYDAYWAQRGWSQQAVIKTESRIDTPSDGKGLRAGRVNIAGVAWAQRRGVRAVQVSIDGGPWQQATLAAQDTIDTWRQWVMPWSATPGRHSIAVRATDDSGYVQTSVQEPPEPNGATGYHTIHVNVH